MIVKNIRKWGTKRNEALLFSEYLDDYVENNCPVRLFDAFVDSLDIEQLGFIKAVPVTMGKPSYDPRLPISSGRGHGDFCN